MSTHSSEVTSGLNRCYRGYVLESVYLTTTEAQRAEILDMWRTEEAGIEGANAERSTREAVFLIRAPSGELAGVSTAALVRLKDGRRFYSCSLFLRKRVAAPYLHIFACDATRDFLRRFKHPLEQPVGMLNINENHRLKGPGVRKLFARHGYCYWGQTTQGEDVWVTLFDESERRDTKPSTVETTPGEAG